MALEPEQWLEVEQQMEELNHTLLQPETGQIRRRQPEKGQTRLAAKGLKLTPIGDQRMEGGLDGDGGQGSWGPVAKKEARPQAQERTVMATLGEGVATAREEDAGASREPFSRTSDRIHLTLTVNVHSSFEIHAY
jgi:hypothetical protein